jgi:hypothetical protein
MPDFSLVPRRGMAQVQLLDRGINALPHGHD